MRKVIVTIAGLTLAAVAGIAAVSAQNAPPTPQQQAERAVKTRQSLFQLNAFTFGPVGGMMRSGTFDGALVQKEAVRLQVLAGLIPDVFKTDTRSFQVMTKAKENIWTNTADFEKRADDLRSAAVALEAAGKKGDKDSITAAAGKVGDACKACHDDYRDK